VAQYRTAQRRCAHKDTLDVMQLDYTQEVSRQSRCWGCRSVAYASGITFLPGWIILAGFIVLPALVPAGHSDVRGS
jgi:hypothetical protein